MQDTPNVIAGGDVLPFRFVKMEGGSGSDNSVVHIADGATVAVGVSEYHTRREDESEIANEGEPVSLQSGEVKWVIAGASFNAGVLVTSGTGGKAVATTDEDYSHGVALQASGGDGEKIRIWFQNVSSPNAA